jgi:16S rRNA processing protein RimM
MAVTDAAMAPEPQRPADAVEVGRIAGAWGVKGAIKVLPFAADPQALFSTKRWYVEPPAVRRPGAPAVLPSLLHIVSAKEQGDHVVASAQELGDRDAAEALKGARILVSRGSFPTPADGEFYWVDLIGCRVFNRAGLELGTVDHLIETGPHCVLVIRPPAAGQPDCMVPFVDAYVDAVDTTARRIDVDWDPGWDGETV